MVITPLRDTQGQHVGFVKITRDLTERHRAQQEIADLNAALKSQIAQLEAANKELEAFSHSVSHDLRAPLRSLDGFSLVLLQDYASKLDAEGRSHLQRIRAASQRMGRLIDDLLNLSRLARLEMNVQDVDLSRMAQGNRGGIAPRQSRAQRGIRGCPGPVGARR